MIGYQQQIGQLYGINVTLWSKETTNQIGSVLVPPYSDPEHENPYSYSVFINNNFGSAKGVDISIQKRYSNYYSGNILTKILHITEKHNIKVALTTLTSNLKDFSPFKSQHKANISKVELQHSKI